MQPQKEISASRTGSNRDYDSVTTCQLEYFQDIKPLTLNFINRIQPSKSYMIWDSEICLLWALSKNKNRQRIIVEWLALRQIEQYFPLIKSLPQASHIVYSRNHLQNKQACMCINSETKILKLHTSYVMRNSISFIFQTIKVIESSKKIISKSQN